MRAKFINDIHRTETSTESVETGLTKYGERYAEFTEKQIHEISMALCGVADCCCGGLRGSRCHDKDGNDYIVMVASNNPAAVALGKLGGSVKSEKKSKSCAENGKKGGRPKKVVLPEK